MDCSRCLAVEQTDGADDPYHRYDAKNHARQPGKKAVVTHDRPSARIVLTLKALRRLEQMVQRGRTERTISERMVAILGKGFLFLQHSCELLAGALGEPHAAAIPRADQMSHSFKGCGGFGFRPLVAQGRKRQAHHFGLGKSALPRNSL